MDLHFTTPKTVQHIHDFPSDYEGRVITTIIESRQNSRDGNMAMKTILYIHGFSDYFFQEHLMETYNQMGIDFIALDLRKYGRSLLPHQHPNYCRSLKEYFPDVDYAIEFILDKNPETQLVLMGHSTGGLLVSYYAYCGALRARIAGLILNSPFFDFNMPSLVKFCIPWVAQLMVEINPYSSYDRGVTDVYGQSLLKTYYGEWKFNEKWKPVRAFPAFYAWIFAVSQAQKAIKNKVKLDIPVLLMHSDKSFKMKKWTSNAQIGDLVLNVKDIERIGLKIGNKMSHFVVKDGLHDLFLSKNEVRETVIERTKQWLLDL